MDATGADALRTARQRAGLTQAELGARAGLPQSVVSAYERGRRDPTVAALRRLVIAAGFDLEIGLAPREAVGPAFTGPIGRKVQRRRREARELLTERQYASPAVFGSVARGTDTPDSDLDLLVDLPPGTGLTQLARMAIDLEALFGVPIDLTPRDALRPRAERDILDGAVAL